MTGLTSGDLGGWWLVVLVKKRIPRYGAMHRGHEIGVGMGI